MFDFFIYCITNLKPSRYIFFLQIIFFYTWKIILIHVYSELEFKNKTKLFTSFLFKLWLLFTFVHLNNFVFQIFIFQNKIKLVLPVVFKESNQQHQLLQPSLHHIHKLSGLNRCHHKLPSVA